MKNERIFMEHRMLKKSKSVIGSFTMAEIIIALSIIGVISAITLPALMGNINEQIWYTQRKALITRVSQAMNAIPSLRGFGKFEGTWVAQNDCNTTATLYDYCNDGFTSYGEDTAAMAFVTEGLSKVMKLTNVCDHEHLSDCNFPEKYKTLSNNVQNTPKRLSEYSLEFVKRMNKKGSNQNAVNIYGGLFANVAVDTHTVGIETINGESMVVLYNPNCVDGITGKEVRFMMNNFRGQASQMPTHMFQFLYTVDPIRCHSQANMCVTFLYDLNGKKGPNKIQKDMGIITAFYPTDTKTVSPTIISRNAPNPSRRHAAESNDKYSMDGNQVQTACRLEDKSSRVPTVDEIKWLHINRYAYGDGTPPPRHEDPNSFANSSQRCYWASKDIILDAEYQWLIDMRGIAYPQKLGHTSSGISCAARCIKD